MNYVISHSNRKVSDTKIVIQLANQHFSPMANSVYRFSVIIMHDHVISKISARVGRRLKRDENVRCQALIYANIVCVCRIYAIHDKSIWKCIIYTYTYMYISNVIIIIQFIKWRPLLFSSVLLSFFHSFHFTFFDIGKWIFFCRRSIAL